MFSVILHLFLRRIQISKRHTHKEMLLGRTLTLFFPLEQGVMFPSKTVPQIPTAVSARVAETEREMQSSDKRQKKDKDEEQKAEGRTMFVCFCDRDTYMNSPITFWSSGQNGWRDDELASGFKDSSPGMLHGRMDCWLDGWVPFSRLLIPLSTVLSHFVTWAAAAHYSLCWLLLHVIWEISSID